MIVAVAERLKGLNLEWEGDEEGDEGDLMVPAIGFLNKMLPDAYGRVLVLYRYSFSCS